MFASYLYLRNKNKQLYFNCKELLFYLKLVILISNLVIFDTCVKFTCDKC